MIPKANNVSNYTLFKPVLALCSVIILSFFTANISNAQNAIAAFSVAGSSSGCAPLNVQFVNNSVNASSYFWDFGNGNTSTLANPTIVYPNAGSYTIKLVATGSNGIKDSLIRNNFISVVQKPFPNFSAGVTDVCLGGQISFTNLSQNFDSCLWDFGDGTTSSITSPVHIYTAAGQFTISLIAYRSAFGCSDAMTKSLYITIHAKPVANFTSGQTSTCNLSQIFSFSSNSTNANSWNWNFGDATTSNLQNPDHTFSSPGIYSVNLITTNSYGCADTLIRNNYITVLNNPQPQIAVTDSSGCVQLNVQFTTGSGASSYSWNFGDGNQSSLQSPYHTYLTAGNYPVSLSVTYPNGCLNSAVFNSINALPTTYANYSLTNFSGCTPLNVQFNNLTTGAGNNYQWNFGDGATSSQTNPVHIYSSGGTYQTTLTVTNSSGCTTQYSYWQNVIVNSPDATFNADIFSGCPPLQVNFSSLTPNSSYQYNWNFGDGTTSSQMHPSHIYSTTGNYTVSLSVTDPSGCTSTFTLPNQIGVNVTQNNFVSPAPVTACAPFNVNFSDSSGGVSSWLWDFGDGSTSTQQNTNHTYTTPGTYNVSLNTHTSGNGCDQTIPVYSTYIIHGGEANFSYNSELCPPYTAYFHDSSTNAVSWLWDFGDGTTSTAQNPTHIYSNPGSYNVTLTITTSDGCTFTSTHDYAINFAPLLAQPAAITNDTVVPLTVQFAANSIGATQWFWDFGDGTTSNLPNPVHVFTQPPPYDISLVISNDSCSVTLQFPNVSFGAGGTIINPDTIIIHEPDPQSGCAPLTVHFHNPKLNTVSWQWDFGDGATSNQANPVHTYSTPGIYDLTLVTYDQAGNVDTMFQPASILVNGVTADFYITYANGCNGNSISLFNNSQNAASYNWNFGDGNTSSTANPVHTYSNINSNYVISFSVTDSAGCSDFQTKSFYGAINNAISADKRRLCGSDTVFFSSSVLNYASYSWDFGDGNYSTLPNPSHIYDSAGVYSVVLNVIDTSGCPQSFNLPYTIEVFNPVANFIVSNIVSNCLGLRYYFTNLSLNSNSYLWDFGDGTTSTVKDPTHYYGAAGNYTVTLTVFANNCSSVYAIPNAVYVPNRSADFSFIKSSDCLPITVNFTDMSVDAVSWIWDFGDGTTSILANPSHVYTTKPSSDVTLTISDAYGCVASKIKLAINPTIASAELTKKQGCSPLQVSFTDSSMNAVSWQWNFGDGTTSTQSNPSHLYQNIGYYNVQLIVTSASGCNDTLNIDSLIRVAGPQAAFSTNIQEACAPTVVDFNDSSLYAETYYWDFGDSSSSTLQNPSHIYVQPGNYEVSLIVSDSVGCSDTLKIQNMIKVRGPVASFSLSGIQGCAPHNVQFTNTSVNALDWFWSFGDGDSSSVLNPDHNFVNPGNYVVSLITHDSTGCESIFTYPDTIHVYASPLAAMSFSDSAGCVPLNCSFNNLSSIGNIFSWDFGDGATSAQTSPSHTYSTPGTFYVSLIASSQGGCSDTLHYPNPVNVYPAPAVDFSADVSEGCAPLVVNFSDLSSGTQNATYLWDFGNGTTSTLQNPLTAFYVPGFYTITLTVTNEGICSGSKTKTAYIRVYDAAPPPVSNILDVTVTSNTTVDITWANVADPDLYEYKLFRLNQNTGVFENIYSVIDTNSSGLNVTSTYTDTGLSTLNTVYTYKMQTVDYCGNRIDLNNLNAHTTMNVTAQAVNKTISVKWTSYGGCSVGQYKILRSNANGNFNEIASVSANENSYLDTTLTCPIGYSYKIKATDLCLTPYISFSDTSVAIPESELANQVIDVVFSTVVDDKNVLTEWNPPQVAPDKVVQYNIYRSTDQVNYTFVEALPPSELKYTDENVDVHHQNYFYKVMIVNECNINSPQGMIGSSILLNSDYNETDETVKLRWTKYQEWDTGVERYLIERKNGNGIWETFKIVDGNTLEAEDK